MEVRQRSICCITLISHFLRDIPFQDAAKAGLKFGDEGKTSENLPAALIQRATSYLDRDAAAEKAQYIELEEKFKPLINWLKQEAGDTVRNGRNLKLAHEILTLPK